MIFIFHRSIHKDERDAKTISLDVY